MPNQLIDTEEIVEKVTDQIENAGYDIDTPASFTGALITPLLDALSDINDNVISSYNRSVLGLAVNEDLEEKTVEFAVAKNSPVQLFDDTHDNFHVFMAANTAKFYAIDQNSPITIPATAVQISSTDGNTWSVTEDIVFEPDAFSAFVPIISNEALNVAVGIGAIGAITVDYTAVINLDLTKSDELQFGCKNNKIISPETVIENDADLRSAAVLRINSMNNTNRDAIRLVLTKYGITDIEFHQDAFGNGTLGVLIRSANSTRFAESTIKSLNNILTNISPGSRILEPDLLVVRFIFDATYIDPADIDNTKAEILTNLNTYFNGLNRGSPISPDVIIETMQNINNVRTFNINCIFVDDRKVVTTRQNALADQLFVLDEDAPISYLI
jgi:hypothetical protein